MEKKKNQKKPNKEVDPKTEKAVERVIQQQQRKKLKQEKQQKSNTVQTKFANYLQVFLTLKKNQTNSKATHCLESETAIHATKKHYLCLSLSLYICLCLFIDLSIFLVLFGLSGFLSMHDIDGRSVI